MKKIHLFLAIFLCASWLSGIASLTSINTLEEFPSSWIPEESQDSSEPSDFNASQAYNYIEQQLEFGYRIPGTNESRACINWVEEEISSFGLTERINFTIRSVNCSHLLLRMNPTHENIIIFAAHYDSRAVAEKDPNEALRTQPILGANDGASGVAVLMELARILHQIRNNLTYQYWFLFIDAEDQGYSREMYGIDQWDWCEGSKWLAAELQTQPDQYLNPTSESTLSSSLDRIHSFILFDMVGGENLKFIREGSANRTLETQIFQTGHDLGFGSAFPLDLDNIHGIYDDHIPFAQIGISTVDLIIEFWNTNSGWPYHHTHGDSLEHIDAYSLQITGSTILAFILANEDYETPSSTLPWWRDPTATLGDLSIEGLISITTLIGLIGLISLYYLYTDVKIRTKQQDQ